VKWNQQVIERCGWKRHEWATASQIDRLSSAWFSHWYQLFSIMELRAKCRRLKLSAICRWLDVDYLQLMTGAIPKGNHEQEIASSPRAEKTSWRVDVPVFCLSVKVVRWSTRAETNTCHFRLTWIRFGQRQDLWPWSLHVHLTDLITKITVDDGTQQRYCWTSVPK
jgi:hypothetical protein